MQTALPNREDREDSEDLETKAPVDFGFQEISRSDDLEVPTSTEEDSGQTSKGTTKQMIIREARASKMHVLKQI